MILFPSLPVGATADIVVADGTEIFKINVTFVTVCK